MQRTIATTRTARAPCPARSVRTNAQRTYTEVVPFGGSARLDVVQYPTESDVASAVCAHIEASAHDAIKKQGFFTLAVPGGSALKALKGLATKKSSVDWKKVYVFFVNHKSSIKLDDPSSTCQRVKEFFGDAVGLPHANIVAPAGTGDAEKDAVDYITKLKTWSAMLKMATTEEGIPKMDLMLIGVGGDGHIGSLYANKPQTTDLQAGAKTWVVTSIKTDGASSITLTLPVMNASKEALVACTGPKKAEIVKNTLEVEQPFGSNPVQLLKPAKLTWLIDETAASQLALRKAMSTMTRTDVNIVKEYVARAQDDIDLNDPLERFCVSNPDADECRVYID